MLEINSVDQILRVLDLARQNRRLGFDTAAACSRAIQQVARDANVRYQTIGDGCRRRLGLVDMSEFHRLVDEWLAGSPTNLATVIKRNATPGASSRISAFFAASQSSAKPTEKQASAKAIAVPKEGTSNPVSVVVEDADARMLRVLAQLEGREPGGLALDLLRTVMRDRLRAALT